MARTDVLIVSAGNTGGWRVAAEELRRSIALAGASVEVVRAKPTPRVRTFALTDFVEALSARRAALHGIAAHEPAAIVYCSITAALLWPRPGAIFVDSIAAENRPGRHGIWQRPVERRRLAQSPLVIAFSPRSLDALAGRRPATVVVPVPVERPTPAPVRDIAAITYAGDPVKRRLQLVLDAWSRARRDGEVLVVAGLDGADLVGARDGVELAGRVTGERFRQLLARARVFLAAPRREDYGIAALEALAAGCMLVSTPSPGPYPALHLARELDPRLIDEDLARAARIALDDPAPRYRERAAELIEPFLRLAVDRTVAERVLPRLLPR